MIRPSWVDLLFWYHSNWSRRTDPKNTGNKKKNNSSLSAVCSVIKFDPYMPSCAVFFGWYVCLHTTKSNHATNKSSTSIPSFVSEYRFERIFSIRNPCENTRYPSNIKQINRVGPRYPTGSVQRCFFGCHWWAPSKSWMWLLLVYTMIWWVRQLYSPVVIEHRHGQQNQLFLYVFPIFKRRISSACVRLA